MVVWKFFTTVALAVVFGPALFWSHSTDTKDIHANRPDVVPEGHHLNVVPADAPWYFYQQGIANVCSRARYSYDGGKTWFTPEYTPLNIDPLIKDIKEIVGMILCNYETGGL